MITKFEVKNFKSFEKLFSFDLTDTKNYAFKPECVDKGVVTKALIYGHNGSGKSNLGFAMLDITLHLSDRSASNSAYQHYLSVGTGEEVAEFIYHFLLDGSKVLYEYGKRDWDSLVYESLSIDGEVLLAFDRRTKDEATILLKGAESLNRDMGDSGISIVNYVKNNSILSDDRNSDLFKLFLKQVEGMLFIRALKDNSHIGMKLPYMRVTDYLHEKGKVKHLEKFLNQAGVTAQLDMIDTDTKPVLVFLINGKTVPFGEIASTGTYSLVVLYALWQQLIESSDVSFLFIDEFDAFYHHGLSKLVVESLSDLKAQVILTTHNTSVISNDILRPDCYFLMNSSEIKSLASRTSKELRSAHNIEKMYRAGAFSA